MAQLLFVSVAREFEVLLEDQAPLESYIEWLDSMVDQCVMQVGGLVRNVKCDAQHEMVTLCSMQRAKFPFSMRMYAF